MAKQVSPMIKTPRGIFNGKHAVSVTMTDTGVVVPNEANQLLFWIEIEDYDQRIKVCQALSDAVEEAHAGKPISHIDWATLYPTGGQVPERAPLKAAK